ncbi:unnamed protein product [Rhodiola kirilowii]
MATTTATPSASLSFFSSSLFSSSSKTSPKFLFSNTSAPKQSQFRPQCLTIRSNLAATLPVLSFTGEKIGETELTVKSAPPETARAVVHRGIITDQRNSRRGTASTLTRAEVRGGGQKPYPQKKTGRARRGSQRTPLRPGGGVIFGPKPKDWSVKINRKEKQLALSTAIASAAANTVVVEDIEGGFEKPSTKEFIAAMRRWGIDPKEKSMFLMTELNDNLVLSSRNIGTLRMLTPRTLNLFDILNSDKLVLTKGAVEYLNQRYGFNNEDDDGEDDYEIDEGAEEEEEGDEPEDESPQASEFAQKHPCISGTLLSLFVLYVFFPLVFRLLIYSSPVMVWVYAYRKNSIKSEHPEAGILKKDDQINGAKIELVKIDGNVLAKKRYVNFSVQNGRMDSRAKNKESADYVPEQRGKSLHTQFNAVALENAQDPEDDNLKKGIRESESDILGKAENDSMKAENDLKKAENSEVGDADWRKANGESESDIFDKAEYEEEDTQKEDAPGDTQTEVEWAKQGERNSMDLGTSETERDRRLESLIQNRRARKLLSMQVRNVIDIMRHPQNQVAPLVIARSTGPFNLINTLSDTDDLHMPGSAPSVLLPTRSPFDLPYDPFEERPNLTGDSSFQQEFITADQKDFSRYEDFCLTFGPRPDGNKERMGMKRHGFSRFRSYRERGSYESLSPGVSSVEHELMSRDDIAIHDSRYEEQSSKHPMRSDNVISGDNAGSENSKTCMNPVEIKEECDPESLNVGSRDGGGPEGPVESAKADLTRNMSSEDLSSYLLKSLASSLQENSVKEAKENGHVQSAVYISSKDLFNVHKRVLHTPALSIASDLVVEVSEAGSPPPTLSPPDGDSSQYDGDVDRDLSSEGEDMSMHVYRTEEQETRSSEGLGKDGLAQGGSIAEAVELDPDVVDEYEHASQTSSDDDSSYENVVHHITEKLKAHRGGYRELSGPALAENSAITSVKQFEEETGLEGGISGSRELDGESSKQDPHGSVEDAELQLPMTGQGSTNMQVSEDVHGGTEMISSGDITWPDTSQAQAGQELSDETSPKSVLPDTDLSDQITRLESQPSDWALADSLSDVTPLESLTPSMDQTAQTEGNQDLMSSPSERNIEEATLNYSISENHNNEADSLVVSVQAESLHLGDKLNADELDGPTEENPEFNRSSPA